MRTLARNGNKANKMQQNNLLSSSITGCVYMSSDIGSMFSRRIKHSGAVNSVPFPGEDKLKQETQ